MTNRDLEFNGWCLPIGCGYCNHDEDCLAGLRCDRAGAGVQPLCRDRLIRAGRGGRRVRHALEDRDAISTSRRGQLLSRLPLSVVTRPSPGRGTGGDRGSCCTDPYVNFRVNSCNRSATPEMIGNQSGSSGIQARQSHHRTSAGSPTVVRGTTRRKLFSGCRHDDRFAHAWPQGFEVSPGRPADGLSCERLCEVLLRCSGEMGGPGARVQQSCRRGDPAGSGAPSASSSSTRATILTRRATVERGLHRV